MPVQPAGFWVKLRLDAALQFLSADAIKIHTNITDVHICDLDAVVVEFD